MKNPFISDEDLNRIKATMNTCQVTGLIARLENVEAELKAAREEYKWLRRNYDENKMLVTDYTAMKAERDRLKNLLEMSEQTRKADIKDLKQMLKNRQKRMSKYREALENIRAIAFDGDGLATAEDLGKDIAELAKAALSGNE